MTALLDRPATAPVTARAPDRRPPSSRSRLRLPEAVLGVVLVVGGALGALLWHRAATTTTTVVTLAQDVARGDRLEASDLVALESGSAPELGLVPWAQASGLVGLRVTTDLPAGAALTPALVERVVPLPPGEALAGVKVAAGAYPAPLEPGDRVDAVAVPPSAVTGTEPAGPVVLLATGAVVERVEPFGDADQSLVVTLRVPVDAARALAGTAAPVRLVQVAG